MAKSPNLGITLISENSIQTSGQLNTMIGEIDTGVKSIAPKWHLLTDLQIGKGGTVSIPDLESYAMFKIINFENSFWGSYDPTIGRFMSSGAYPYTGGSGIYLFACRGTYRGTILTLDECAVSFLTGGGGVGVTSPRMIDKIYGYK